MLEEQDLTQYVLSNTLTLHLEYCRSHAFTTARSRQVG